MLDICFFSRNVHLNYDKISEYFPKLGFPSWLVAPLAAAKILGIIAVLSNKSKLLTEWAYAGFFFDAVLSFGAHYTVEDGGGMMSIQAIVATLTSRKMMKWRY